MKPQVVEGAVMVGRGEELDQLRSALKGLTQGEGGVVTLEGEAGIGKSRLAHELKSLAEQTDARWFAAQARAEGAGTAYHVVADLLRDLFDIGAQDGPAVGSEKLYAGCGRYFADKRDAAEILGPVLGAEPDDARVHDPELWRQRLYELLTGLDLGRAVICLEDLHWGILHRSPC